MGGEKAEMFITPSELLLTRPAVVFLKAQRDVLMELHGTEPTNKSSLSVWSVIYFSETFITNKCHRSSEGIRFCRIRTSLSFSCLFLVLSKTLRSISQNLFEVSSSMVYMKVLDRSNRRHAGSSVPQLLHPSAFSLMVMRLGAELTWLV